MKKTEVKTKDKYKKEKKSNHMLDNIKALRAVKNYSQEYIANKLGCDYSTYGKIENGKTELTIKRLGMIAEVLGTTVEDLMRNREESNTKSFNSITELKGTVTLTLPFHVINTPEFTALFNLITKK